jgi:hypothetical protein
MVINKRTWWADSGLVHTSCLRTNAGGGAAAALLLIEAVKIGTKRG